VLSRRTYPFFEEASAIISVIVPTYHRDQPLIDTVSDLLLLIFPDYEVVVVDQAPCHSPAAQERLAQWHEQGAIRWIQTAQPGLTAARNRGIEASRGHLIVFVDDDVRIPDQNFLRAHGALFAAHPEVMASGGRVLEPSQPPRTVTSLIGWLGPFGMREPGFGSTFSGPASSLRGCNMAFRKTALTAIGGFDERYTRSAFREDTDVSWRLRRAGYAVWFNHEAWLYHLSAATGGTRDREIAIEQDLILNDWRYAVFNLPPAQRMLWVSRLYGSRVVKAALLHGAFLERHRIFVQSCHAAWRESKSVPPQKHG
jgi:GT2 family glycosyltransferase